MQPEDRLDALLSMPRQPERGAATASTATNRSSMRADAELVPLLHAARTVGTLSVAAPDPDFAADLRKRMLTRSTDLRWSGGIGNEPAAPTGHHERPATRPAPGRGRFPAWAAMAAAALLAVSVGAATAAAHAGPASPLFGLHRLEQGIQVAAANDNASRARLHMRYARQWLAALGQAASQHEGSDVFQSALAAMEQENAATASDVAQETDGATRASLQSEQSSLESDERAGLLAALRQVGWDDRIAATTALGQLGATVPRVTQVIVGRGPSGVQVSVVGAGFQPGAQLVINGRPVGQVVTTTPTLLVVGLEQGDNSRGVTSVGVSNPDGTAAVAQGAGVGGLFTHGADATEPPNGNEHGTPSTNDHGGGTPTPGDHSHDGEGSGTPTPQATRTGDQ